MNREHAATVRNLLQARHPDAVVTVIPEPDGAQIIIAGVAMSAGVTTSAMQVNQVTMSVSDNGLYIRKLIAESSEDLF